MPDTVDILLPSEKGAPLTRAEGEAQWIKVEDALNGLFDGSKKAGNADKLDGFDSIYFAPASHNHDTAYLGIAGKAADADKLDGFDSSDFARFVQMAGAVGNINSPLLHLPLKKNLLTQQGQSVCTFTRASAATYADRYGMLKSVAADTPRFTADGLLIEGASTNLLTYSEQFDNAAWVKAGASIVGNTTETTDPFGTNMADKLTEDTSTGNHQVNQIFATTVGNTNTRSVFLKAMGRSRVYIHSYNGTTNKGAYFDLSAGTVISSDSGVTAEIKQLANGWYRCSITLTETAINERLQIRLVATGTTTSYTGDGTSGVCIFGAQLEAMPFATSYIPTTTASATRAAEVCSFPINENAPKLQQAGGYSFLADVKLIGAFSATDQIALGGDTTASRHLIGFYGTNMLSFSKRSLNKNIVTSGIDRLKVNRYSVSVTDSKITGYVNGNSIVEDTATSSAENSSVILIGSASGGRYLFGTISNLRIYDRALTAEEVRLA